MLSSLCLFCGYLIISDGEPVPLATLGLGQDGRCQVPRLTYLSKKTSKNNLTGKSSKVGSWRAKLLFHIHFLFFPFMSFQFLSFHFPFLSIPFLVFQFLSCPFTSLHVMSSPFISFLFPFNSFHFIFLSFRFLSLHFISFHILFFSYHVPSCPGTSFLHPLLKVMFLWAATENVWTWDIAVLSKLHRFPSDLVQPHPLS